MVDEGTPLEREIAQWQGFGSIRYQDDRILFDRMMSEAKQYSAAFQASGKEPAEALFLTSIFQQQKMINKLLAVIESEEE